MRNSERQRCRTCARVADRIRDALRRRQRLLLQAVSRDITGFTASLPRLQRHERRFRGAVRRGYTPSAHRLHQRSQLLLTELRYHIDGTLRTLGGRVDPVPRPHEIARELDQLERDLGPWGWDRRGTLTVRTEPITLEDVDLGPFEIRLDVNDLSELDHRMPYTVVALDPQPAADDTTVTHPHIRDDRLCAGDASYPINRALAQGRIADAMLLIRSVVRQYNPESPYVAIDDWNGEPCPECGARMSDNEKFLCEDCDRDVCEDCRGVCDLCDTVLCGHCLHRCQACQDAVCRECGRHCPDRDAFVCTSCLETPTPAPAPGSPGSPGSPDDRFTPPSTPQETLHAPSQTPSNLPRDQERPQPETPETTEPPQAPAAPAQSEGGRHNPEESRVV